MRLFRRIAAPDLASHSHILINNSYAGAGLCRADGSRDARGPSAHDKNVDSLT
jgi:hypothetical protein